MKHEALPPPVIARRLDICADRCPLTFLKTKRALERMADGEVLEVILQGETPLSNVPRSCRAEGHEVLALEAIDATRRRLLVRKGTGKAGARCVNPSPVPPFTARL